MKFKSEYGHHMYGTVGMLVSDAFAVCPNTCERRKALLTSDFKMDCSALSVGNCAGGCGYSSKRDGVHRAARRQLCWRLRLQLQAREGGPLPPSALEALLS